MKVLFLHNSFSEYRIKFWEYLAESNKLKLIITHQGLEKKLYSLNIKKNDLDVSYWNHKTWNEIKYFISEFDVVVLPPSDSIFDYIVSLYVISLCKLKKVPYVYWTEMWEVPVSQQPFLRKIKNLIHKLMIVSLCKGAKCCIASGSKCKAYLENNNLVNISDKIFVAYDSNTSPQSCVDIRSMYNISQDAKIVLFLGRIIERKGLHILIEALSPLLQKNNIVLLVCGDGDYVEKCKRISDRNNLCDKVIFAGKIQPADRGSYYLNSDLFVIPALRWHGMIDIWALTVNESLEQGTPVIATDAVGAAYDLIDKHNGKMVGQGSIEELTEAIQEVLLDKKLFLNRKYIKNTYNSTFSVKCMADSFQEYLEFALNK